MISLIFTLFLQTAQPYRLCQLGHCPEEPVLFSCPSVCPAGEPDAESVFWDATGVRWISTLGCSGGGPYCWGSRFEPGDVVEWVAKPPYDPVNDGLYTILPVRVGDGGPNPWYVENDPVTGQVVRRWYADLSPPVPATWRGCCGEWGTLRRVALGKIFRDGFESGDTSAWSRVVGGAP